MTSAGSKPVVIVTGAGGAIGTAVADRLAQTYAPVLADINGKAADRVASAIPGAIGMAADVSRKADVERVMTTAAERFGRIDALVNIAGVSSFGSFAELPEEEWDRVLAINLKSVFLCCQAAIPHLRAAGGGRIVSISSVLAKNGGNARPWVDRKEQEAAGNAAYGASKAGINALTIYLARELAADGITVNAVAPGPVATGMTASFPETLKALIPVGRMGTPQDVAAAVSFLVGPDTGFITGEIIDVNGGLWGD